MLNKQKGFTLVELLIVIAIIGILAVAIIATINPLTQQQKAKRGRIQSDLQNFASAAETYGATCGTYADATGTADDCVPVAGTDVTGAASEAGLNTCIGYWTDTDIGVARVSNSTDPDGNSYTGCCTAEKFCVEGQANGTFYQYDSTNGRVTNSPASSCSC